MKNYFLWIGLICLYLINFTRSQTISPYLIGQNAWMPDTIGIANNCTDPPCLLNGKLHKKWKEIGESFSKTIRFGGIAPDKNRPTNYQYIKMIDSIRAKGMEPIIQVPFHIWRFSASDAANIVQYINITKGKNVKYWIIGNEPDLGYSYTSAAQIAAYFKPFSSAMKAIDPTIKIIGPECAWYNQGIINGLTTPNGPDDITGKDAAGNYYIDYISFHIYPFNGTQTRTQVITKLTSTGSFQDNLIALNQRLSNCNSTHNRTGSNAIKAAVTEANVSWQNNSGDNLYGNGANSFIGGQFIAELSSICMKQNVQFLNIWSVVEGNSNVNNIGYIDPGTGNKKPSYYHFQMLAEHFKGNYLQGSTNNSLVKAFACSDNNKIKVMILNQDQSNGYNFTLSLNNASINSSSTLKININGGLNYPYFNDYISEQSTVLYTFNESGIVEEKIIYELNTQAAANQPPQKIQFNITTGISQSPTVSSNTSFGIKRIYPVPVFENKFTIEMNGNRSDISEEELELNIYNILGQMVQSKKYSFRSGKDEIELPHDLANGEYIVSLREGKKDNYIRQKIIVIK